LDLDAETVQAAACGMEHGIEEEALERIVCFVSFTKKRQPGGTKWLAEFRKFIRKCGKGKICRECIEEYKKCDPESD
ncbi:MAG: iron dependent repressor, metal binding and dimerization domain protein, partial [Lentisphaeria bacterium]